MDPSKGPRRRPQQRRFDGLNRPLHVSAAPSCPTCGETAGPTRPLVSKLTQPCMLCWAVNTLSAVVVSGWMKEKLNICVCFKMKWNKRGPCESHGGNQKLPCGTFKFTPLCSCPDTELTLYTVKWGTWALRNVALSVVSWCSNSCWKRWRLSAIILSDSQSLRPIQNLIHAREDFIGISFYPKVKTFSHFYSFACLRASRARAPPRPVLIPALM